ncbi:1677_t:CDS:1, partial [Cetraspora pellucida]
VPTICILNLGYEQILAECLTRGNEKSAQEFMLPSPRNTVNICDLGETGAIGSSGSS